MSWTSSSLSARPFIRSVKISRHASSESKISSMAVENCFENCVEIGILAVSKDVS
jgi:hypothetical protein